MLKKTTSILKHLLFWGINYWYVTSGNLSWNGFSAENGALGIAYTYGMLANAIMTYTQMYWLVPFYFLKDKKLKYWSWSAAIFLACTGIESFLDYQLGIRLDLYQDLGFPVFVMFLLWFFHNSFFHFIYAFMGFLNSFPKAFLRAEGEKQALLKATHQAELTYLKSQLNPHFLFNGMNSIYHLIGKNNDLAKSTVLDFSNLLRYQLYESRSDEIDLTKELAFIKEYIAIEKVRKGTDAVVIDEINQTSASISIAPLLLIPFVENAFKHISNHENGLDNKINITIKESEGILTLNIENTVDIIQTNIKTGGLGLDNVKRRLVLLYPQQYELEILEQEDSFLVNLTLNLQK